VLKGENHDVFDSLDRSRERVSRESLADDDLDAANVITRVPVALEQQLATKLGESQTF
jgi:hypothetical protein